MKNNLVYFLFLTFSVGSIGATQEELLRSAQESAMEAAGKIQMQAPQQDFKAEDEYEKYGIEDTASIGSVSHSGPTKLSATFKSSKEFTCTNDKSVFVSYMKIKFTTCDSMNDIYEIEFCPSLDGAPCTQVNMRTANLTLGVPYRFDDNNEIKIVSCSGQRCEIEVIHVPEDEFSGDLEQEAENRESTNPHPSTQASLANLNSPYYDEFKAEADDTSDYMNRAMQSVDDNGEMPIYRNSPTDIAQFGNRDGSIAFDAESLEGGEICTDDSANNFQTCSHTMHAAEYICDQDAPVCSFERVESQIQACGRKLTMTCNRPASCAPSYFNYSGYNFPSTAEQTESILLNKRYIAHGNYYFYNATASNLINLTINNDGSFRMKNNSGNNGLDNSPYYRPYSFTFQIKDINKILRFMYTHTNHDDYLFMKVNGEPVYTAPRPSKVSASCLPVRDMRFVTIGKFQRVVQATCNNGSKDNGKYDDRGQYNSDVNLDLKPYLNNGINTIEFTVLVIGGGDFNLLFTPEFECGCNWGEVWEDLPCAY